MNGENNNYYNWFPGLIMVGVGIAFLVGYFTDFELDNWWAYFMLIPVFGSFANAANEYRSHGYMTAAARGSIFGGSMILLVAAIFIFGLSWQIMWPIAIIFVGLNMMFGQWGRKEKEKSPEDMY